MLDKYQDAWATAQWTQNAVVWVKASPDVANDQTLARGRFHFYRTGSAAQLAATQLVNFSLPVTPLATYPSPATYGSTGTGDYTFAVSTNNVPSAWTVGSGSGTVTFAANQTEAVLDVVPRKDTKLETNVVYLAVTAGTGYAVTAAGNIISPPSATVLIYDGPEFALYELGDYTPVLSRYPGYGGSPRSPDATGAYALDNNATPKIAGGASYLAGYSGPDQLFGGWWTSAATTQIRDYYNDRINFWQGYGAPTLGVSDNGIFVGQKGNNAFKFTTAANSAVNLPHLSTQNVSAAMAINPQGDGPTPNPGENNRYIVGSSRHATGVDRPVVWWGGSATPTDLSTAGVSIVATDGKGLATGVNDVGEVVGWAELKVGTGTAKATRAFRSREVDFFNALPLVAGDELLPLGSQTDVNNLAVAWAIGANNIAVGSSIVKNGPNSITNAVFWAARSGVSANPVASLLTRLPSLPNVGGQHEATAINYDTTPPGNAGYNRSYIGGWSFDGTTNRATLWRGVSTTVLPLDLNDQHFAYRGTSWWLETIEAINNSKAMVGTGWFNGKRRGYLLVPLTPGT